MLKKRFYPEKIKVGNTYYTLELVPFIEEKNGEVTRGYHYPDEKKILLLSTLSQKDLFSTFIHECLHAIEEEHNIKIRHKLIYAIEEPLANLIHDNFYILPRR